MNRHTSSALHAAISPVVTGLLVAATAPIANTTETPADRKKRLARERGARYRANKKQRVANVVALEAMLA
jgi:hypothetical protein